MRLPENILLFIDFQCERKLLHQTLFHTPSSPAFVYASIAIL